MEDNFAELKRLFDGEVAREALIYRDEALAHWNVTMEQYQAGSSGLYEKLIRNSKHHGTKKVIARLLDGYTISAAKSALMDSAALFDLNHKVKAENI